MLSSCRQRKHLLFGQALGAPSAWHKEALTSRNWLTWGSVKVPNAGNALPWRLGKRLWCFWQHCAIRSSYFQRFSRKVKREERLTNTICKLSCFLISGWASNKFTISYHDLNLAFHSCPVKICWKSLKSFLLPFMTVITDCWIMAWRRERSWHINFVLGKD